MKISFKISVILNIDAIMHVWGKLEKISIYTI